MGSCSQLLSILFLSLCLRAILAPIGLVSAQDCVVPLDESDETTCAPGEWCRPKDLNDLSKGGRCTVKPCHTGCRMFIDGCQNVCRCNSAGGVRSCTKNKCGKELITPFCAMRTGERNCADPSEPPCEKGFYCYPKTIGDFKYGVCVPKVKTCLDSDGPACGENEVCKEYIDIDGSKAGTCVNVNSLDCSLPGNKCTDDYWCKISTPLFPTQSTFGTCVKHECPEGCTLYNDGCNDCTCNSDGSLGTCTKLSCKQVSGKEPYCKNQKCGGPTNIKCPAYSGTWCQVDPNSTEKLGDCVSTKCPKGCQKWYDGCNECDCSTNPPTCTKKECPTGGNPFCLDDTGVVEPKCSVEDSITVLADAYKKLDSDGKKKLIDNITGSKKLR